MEEKRNVVQLTFEFYKAVKASTSCVMPQCGTRENIEFHHVDPKTKLHNVANIARTGTIEELVTELRKCVPLCAAHHKRVHRGQIKGWLRGQFDNGKPSHDREAQRYMPFRPFFTGLIAAEKRGNDKRFVV